VPNKESQPIHPIQQLLGSALTLQLHFSFDVSVARCGLVGSSPKRPCDDLSGLDTPLREFDGDTSDFLDRPADQERLIIAKREIVFFGGTALAW
jgi:hypothetical protein